MGSIFTLFFNQHEPHPNYINQHPTLAPDMDQTSSISLIQYSLLVPFQVLCFSLSVNKSKTNNIKEDNTCLFVCFKDCYCLIPMRNHKITTTLLSECLFLLINFKLNGLRICFNSGWQEIYLISTKKYTAISND